MKIFFKCIDVTWWRIKTRLFLLSLSCLFCAAGERRRASAGVGHSFIEHVSYWRCRWNKTTCDHWRMNRSFYCTWWAALGGDEQIILALDSNSETLYNFLFFFNLICMIEKKQSRIQIKQIHYIDFKWLSIPRGSLCSSQQTLSLKLETIIIYNIVFSTRSTQWSQTTRSHVTGPDTSGRFFLLRTDKLRRGTSVFFFILCFSSLFNSFSSAELQDGNRSHNSF